jgi:two-component system chemotaxis response regulator CheY
MAYEFENVSVLVVEDNQPMLDLVKSLLQTFGVKNILSARDGEAGFEIYRKQNPDLIIADWMMRPMDGISMTRQIRSDPKGPNPFVPIILMTGFSEQRRVVQSRDAGITEFLVKPFNARDLYRRIYQIIERPRQFVKSEDFFGPDRRRRGAAGFTGPFKRETDVRPEDYNSDIQKFRDDV